MYVYSFIYLFIYLFMYDMHSGMWPDLSWGIMEIHQQEIWEYREKLNVHAC